MKVGAKEPVGATLDALRIDSIPSKAELLQRVKAKYSHADLLERLKRLSSLKVLVIGDLIIDEYCYCQVSGTVTKSPVIAAIFESSHAMAGGSAVIARHVRELVGQVDLLTTVGDRSDSHSFVTDLLDRESIGHRFFNWRETFTVRKLRYISGGYPSALDQDANKKSSKYNVRLFEIGYMPRAVIPNDLEAEICGYLKDALPLYDLVIVADFGHGTISPRIAQAVAKYSKWWAVNAQTNSSNFGFNRITKYSNANYVCIDELEARLPSGDKVGSIHSIAHELRAELRCEGLMVTRGSLGLILLGGERAIEVPALAEQVVDTVGAGDAVLAVSALCQHAKIEQELTALLGASHGALASLIVGNEEPVRKARLLDFLSRQLNYET